MTDTPAPKKRGGARPGAGRPRKHPEGAPPPDEGEQFLDKVMSERRSARRGCKLQADEKTLRTVFECAKLFCVQEEVAAVLGVSLATFKRFMSDVPEAREAWEDGQQHARISLRRKQLARCDKSDTINIFLGKNYLGQKDEHHTTTTVNKPASEMTEEQLLEIASRGATEPDKPSKKVH